MENYMDYAAIAQAVTPGNYIAIWKVILFLVFFGLWAWVGQWLDRDTLYIRANRLMWNYIDFGAGMVGVLLCFFLPAPVIVNIVLFLVIWGTITFAYVFQRNASVSPSDRILTMDHLQSLFSRQHRPKEVKHRLVFVSANKNVIPVPARQDEMFDNYVAAEDLLYDISYRRVSRAELLPMGETCQLRFVIDGVLGIGGEKTRLEAEQIIAYLKEISGLDTKERRRPQTGYFKTVIDGADVEWRFKTAGSTRGEQMVLERIVKGKMIKVEELGFDSHQAQAVRELIEKKSGLVLVSGPPASGVTTTLYSMIRSHDAFLQTIHTLEKEQEIPLDNITQHVLDVSDPEKTSARQLQAVMRVDPDVLMVGFIENADMAKLCVTAARDGKKIYAAMNSIGAIECLQKWLELTADKNKTAEILLAITCQRLLRKLCPECRVGYIPDANLIKKLNLPAEKIKQFYRPPKEEELEYDKKGNVLPCTNCQGTGYFGRTAVIEALFITDPIREMIRSDAPMNTIRAQSRKDRMRYLQEQALLKVIDGTTIIQAGARLTSDKPAAKPDAASTPQK